ncbi:variable surface protein [Plasmodium gonderi]|uniref:Variable surface protein n=1 Tax=Plasmodium gonderi TaxID=77519 RepID=A0A1Y1JP51_PLAGO|nr:variable surface protein [Plasmodium gonderi]GAW84251.1 variable surface protein [Plasmodium gonderi]
MMNMDQVHVHESLKKLGEDRKYIFYFVFMFFQNNFLTDKPLYDFYYVLNNAFDKEDKKHVIINDKLKQNGEYTYIKQLFDNLRGILNEWKNILKIFKLHYKNNNSYCNYLNFWMHNKIITKNFPEETIHDIYNEWDILNKEISTNDTCYRKNFHMSEDKFKKKKKLFEFLEYYEYIKDKMSYEGLINREKYCDYIRSIFALYYEIINENNNNPYNIYGKELENFKNIFNYVELSELIFKCPNNCRSFLNRSVGEKVCSLNEPLEKFVKDIISSCNIDENSTLDESIGVISEYINVSQQLMLQTKYEEFNKEITMNDYVNYNTYCSKILPLNSKYCGIFDLCIKISRNLSNLGTNENLKNEKHVDRCIYFLFWTYYEIYKIFHMEKKNIHNIPEAIELLKITNNINHELTKENLHNISKGVHPYNNLSGTRPSDYYKLINYTPCTYYINCDLKECIEKKHLFDFFKNSESIKDIIISNTNSCNYYSKYLDYIITLYKKYRYDNDGYDCCLWGTCANYFNCDADNNPNKIKFKCSTEISRSSSLNNLHDGSSKNSIEDYLFADTRVKKTLENLKCYRRSNRGDYISDEIVCEDNAPLDKDINVIKKKIQVIQPGSINFPYYDVIIYIIFTVLGTFLIFFIYYKFTPLGLFLQRKFAKRRKTKYSLQKEHIGEDIKFKEKYENANSASVQPRIAYHPE